jgi:hypothetical protein
VKAEK